MKNVKKTAAAALVLGSVFVTGAFAGGVAINATLRQDINVVIDGTTQNFKDAAGTAVYPISYNNTTYLPIRSIGGIMGKTVGWDEGTQTITLSNASQAATGSAGATKSTPEAAAKNIHIDAQKTESGVLCVFITNNNDFTVDELEVKVLYKDNAGQVIDVQGDGHDMVLPGATVVSRLETPTDYATFSAEPTVELDCNPRYKNHAKDVAVSANKGDKSVILEITNNAKVAIEEIEYVVVLYRNDKIVSVTYPTDITNVPAGKTLTEKVDTYDTNFDSFKVYLNQAHTFS